MRQNIKPLALIVFLVFIFVGCTPSTGTQGQEQIKQDKNQAKLTEVQPLPEIPYSANRQNLIDRMKRMNDKNLVGYVYLLSDTGQVVSSYVTKGRVTSMQQYLTSYDAIVNSKGELCAKYDGTSAGCYTVESPDLDGTYGYHPEGIFFFTDTGAMVEWAGKYVWTDQPLSVRTPVSLVRTVK